MALLDRFRHPVRHRTTYDQMQERLVELRTLVRVLTTVVQNDVTGPVSPDEPEGSSDQHTITEYSVSSPRTTYTFNDISPVARVEGGTHTHTTDNPDTDDQDAIVIVSAVDIDDPLIV